MGITRFRGPVYGAKGLLWVAGPAAAATTSASTALAFVQGGYAKRQVPVYEDWFITEAYITVSTMTTTAGAYQWQLKTEGGSSNSQRSNGESSTNAATLLTIASGGSSKDR